MENMQNTTEFTRKDWSDLEFFIKPGPRKGGVQLIRINQNGLFALSSAFMTQNRAEIDRNTHAILGFSKRLNAIVVQLVNDEEIQGVRKLSKGRSATHFSHVSFLRTHGLNPEQVAGSYIPELESIPQKGVSWVIYLDKKMK